MNRRDFFRKSAAAAAGAAMLGAMPLRGEENLTVNGLPAVILGRTGLKVTKISFGGILITEPAVLSRVIDSGINFVHTSPGYQNGKSLEAFGKVLKTQRSKVVVALKTSPSQLDEALKVLNTDYVDILIPGLHSVADVESEGLREGFEKAKAAGKCGFMGFADHSDMANILNRAVELGYYDVSLLSYADASNPVFLTAVKKAVEAGMGIMTMKGLPKRGSEQSTPEEKANITSRCTSMVTTEHAHTVLASMGSFQSVDLYRNILETKLGFIDRRLEENYWASQQGNYCAMCDRCSGVCPNGVAIRKVVRYRMYDTDYGMHDYARAKYSQLSSGCNAGACESCGLCEQVCKRSLPVRELLAEAHARLA
jgi:predicted aldo/keto reductase-like oxidoreductase